MRSLTFAIGLVILGAALATTVHATSSAPEGMYLHVKNGARIKTPRKTAVYMVDRGVLRHVHYAAYKRLWAGWGGITLVNEIPEASVGEPIRGTTRLVRVEGERQVWYIDNDRVRRAVPTFYASGMHAPKFSGTKVETVSRESLLAHHVGPDLR